MRNTDGKDAGRESPALKIWFSTIARYFPLGELHLFSKDLKYLFSAHSKRKKQEVTRHFPANKSVVEVLDKKLASQIAANLDRVLHGETVSFEAEYEGSRFLTHAVPMFNPADRETYILLHSTDVTEIKDIQHKSAPLKPGEGRKVAPVGRSRPAEGENAEELFCDATPVPMFFSDTDGRILGINKAFSEVVGYDYSEARRLSLFDLEPACNNAVWERDLNEIRKSGRLTRRVVLKGKDGRSVEGEVEFRKATKDSQKLIHATFRTPEEFPRTEEALQSEERLRLISENVPDLIAVLDVKGKHVYLNPSYKNIISDPNALLGKKVLEIVHPDDRERVERALKEGLESGLEQRIEFRLLAPDGGVQFVEAQGKAVHDENGALRNAVIVSRDITEKRTVEEQYFRNQRIESLGTLASGISHDLNNVLTPVILGVEALRRIHMDERGLAILNSISASLSRGRDIVKQVLTFARGVEGGSMLIQPRHIVKEAVSLMKETFPKSIAIVENVPKALWLINGDATRINQLLMNLGVNARDAMPDGGILYISADNVMIDEQFAVMKPGARPGPYVVLTVQDTGIGMSREVKERIFEPFFTTKEVGKGTGLGLSVVHSIAKSHGGFITVESELGKSTTFKIYFPAIETSEMERPNEQDARLFSGNGELLMVVDDEVAVCQITKQTLEAFGYRAVTATDGTEAVALFAEKKNEVSLVLMDIAMPVMDGPRTIRALRRLKPHVKIIASSGIVTEEYINLEDAAAPNAFLPKPYTADKLLRVVYSTLKGS